MIHMGIRGIMTTQGIQVTHGRIKEHKVTEGNTSGHGGTMGQGVRVMVEQRKIAAAQRRQVSSRVEAGTVTVMEGGSKGNGGEKCQGEGGNMGQHSRVAAAQRRQSSSKVEAGNVMVMEGGIN